MLSVPQASEYHMDHPGYLWIRGGRISPQEIQGVVPITYLWDLLPS